MHYVYLIKSISTPDKTYIGLTKNLKKRVNEHNSGKSPHTEKFKPWQIEIFIAFRDREKAKRFEYYLKQGSGYAFAKKHFW